MDMHVLAGDGTKYTVVFHFSVPSGNNSAGQPWRDVLASTNPVTILTEGTAAWGINAIEKAAIEVAGTVVEWVVQLDIEPGRNTAAKVTRALQHAFPREETKMRNELRRRFRWYGMTESEAP